MKKHTLQVTNRSEMRRKVRNLRRQGNLPATIYGKKIKSTSVTVKTDEFLKVYKEAGESGLVELSLDSSVRPVLIHNVQIDPIKGYPQHVEFYQVDLKEKVHTKVPLKFTGEAPAVINKLGVLLTILDEVEVEALPTDLPEHIVVDVSSLAEVEQEIKVSDLKAVPGVTMLADGGLTVIKIGALVTKEAEVEAAAEEAAKAAAAAESAEAAGGGEEAAGGEAAAEDKTPEKSPEEKKE